MPPDKATETANIITAATKVERMEINTTLCSSVKT